WKQGERRVRKYLLPRWGKLPAKSITRRDVLAIFGRIKAPVLANQVLKAASAVFGFGVKMEIIGVNPCIGIEVNPTQSRERILGDDEFPKFWQAFGTPDVIRGSASKSCCSPASAPARLPTCAMTISAMDGGPCLVRPTLTGRGRNPVVSIACGCRSRRETSSL